MRWNCEAIDIVGGSNAETTRRKRLPDGTNVSAIVEILVSLDPGITSLNHRGVAWLKEKGCVKDTKEYDVATSRFRISEGVGGPSEATNKFCVYVVKHVCPDLTDIVHL